MFGENNYEKPNHISALCAALIETKVAGNKLEAKTMKQSHQLLQTRNYNIGIAVGATEIWTTQRVSLDTRACPILLKKIYRDCMDTVGTNSEGELPTVNVY